MVTGFIVAVAALCQGAGFQAAVEPRCAIRIESSRLSLPKIVATLDGWRFPHGSSRRITETRIFNQTISMALTNAPDLTKGPPRSPRVRLGGYVILPRMLDKGRATIAGKNGAYHYDCPTDQRFLGFVGIDATALKKQLAADKGDGEVLQWIEKNAKHKRTEAEIAFWSAHCEQRAPSDVESREFFQEEHQKIAPKREDVVTWFDYLDLDDYVAFGGKA